jgi:cytochrome c553
VDQATGDAEIGGESHWKFRHRDSARGWWSFGFSMLVLGCAATVPAPAPAPAESPSGRSWTYDPENAEEILATCAGCHGKNAAGGGQGEYPRLAGLDERYIIRQLRAFESRQRINIPMYSYATKRELPEDDVLDIARLVSQIELPTKPAPPDAEMSSYQRLLAAQAVFNVPRVDGDIERGFDLYDEECSDCHGEQGWGEDDTPQLAGQYTDYLRRQIQAFRSGRRINEDMDGVFDGIDANDLEDIFAFLASRDD